MEKTKTWLKTILSIEFDVFLSECYRGLSSIYTCISGDISKWQICICRSIWIAGPWINGILNIYKLGNYSLRTHVYWLNTFHLGIYQKIEGEKSIPLEMPSSDSPRTSWIAERPTWEDQVHASITGTGQHWESLVQVFI